MAAPDHTAATWLYNVSQNLVTAAVIGTVSLVFAKKFHVGKLSAVPWQVVVVPLLFATALVILVVAAAKQASGDHAIAALLAIATLLIFAAGIVLFTVANALDDAIERRRQRRSQ